MIKELIQNPIFFLPETGACNKKDLQIAENLFDILIAHKEGSFGMATKYDWCTQTHYRF